MLPPPRVKPVYVLCYVDANHACNLLTRRYCTGIPDVWIRPAVKLDGTEYHETVLCYADDVFAISATPMKTIEVIKAVFNLKGNKEEVTDMYLGALIQKVETLDGTECWMMSSEKYANADVENVELNISKSN